MMTEQTMHSSVFVTHARTLDELRQEFLSDIHRRLARLDSEAKYEKRVAKAAAIGRDRETAERLVVPRADMPEAVDDALLVQNAIGDDQLVDKFGIGRKLRQGVNSLRFQKNRMQLAIPAHA